MKVRDIDGMKGQDKTTSFSYHVDGQLAERSIGNESERFFWDGLALVRRNDTSYLNEPSVTGGNPILADDKVMFNDMLGNTLGIYGKDLQEVKRTSFGSGDEAGFFTGKPYVKELGAVFLFRNYRSDLGKWQTSDPLGYPDGWNNFAYCNNGVVNNIDFGGGWVESVHHQINYYWLQSNSIDWAGYKWGDLSINILNQMDSGSDWTDSFWEGNQASQYSYMHAMRSGELSDVSADIALAESRYWSYLLTTRNEAMDLSDKAREYYRQGNLSLAEQTLNSALFKLGAIVHSMVDSYSPSHAGFQHFSYWSAPAHLYAERYSVYESSYKSQINNFLNNYKFVLDHILQQPE